MPTLFAIGGGEIADAETRAIDEAILNATGVKDPRVLFLPTASGDADEYAEKFETYYGQILDCEVDVARVAGANEDAIAEKVDRADAVYVGGGDTGYVLDTWRTRGIDDLLRDAWESGTVMSGLSAGALCWFDGGLSDAIAIEDVDYGPVDGLGFVPDLHATVHATPARRESFRDYLAVRDAAGIALEDNAAVEVTGDEWRIHASSENAFAFRVGADGSVEPLPVDGACRPLSDLR